MVTKNYIFIFNYLQYVSIFMINYSLKLAKQSAFQILAEDIKKCLVRLIILVIL